MNPNDNQTVVNENVEIRSDQGFFVPQKKTKVLPLFLVPFTVLLVGGVFLWSQYSPRNYEKNTAKASAENATLVKNTATTTEETSVNTIHNDIESSPSVATPIQIFHLDTPEVLKAVYMTSWVAGIKNRYKIIDLIDTTEINSVVIDIKDYTGKVAFEVNDPELEKENSSERRITDIREFTNLLHRKNIYVIGRIAVFQDPYFIIKHPELAVRTETDPEKIWRDYKGIAWLDAGSQEVWDYVLAIAKEAYDDGFDEINFDYVRYPSDGNLHDISYPISGTTPRAEVMKSFFEYVHERLTSEGIKSSVDIFGLTTTEKNDLGIGQVLEDALANFDYVSPMVYPSHYASGAYGYAKPAIKPYEIVYHSMKRAVERAKAMGVDEKKLRPWLQDFDLGAKYTADMVRAQINATYDSGLDSWMLWDPANTYTRGALMTDEEASVDMINRQLEKEKLDNTSTDSATEGGTDTTVN